jgi:class 3 adenylate cyclase
VQPHGNALLLGFPDVEAAADAALAMRALPALDRYPTRIAGAYGLVHIVQREVAGSAVATATAVLEASMTGAVTVNDLFADALALRSDGRSVETLGDFGQASGPPLPLYALIDDPD